MTSHLIDKVGKLPNRDKYFLLRRLEKDLEGWNPEVPDIDESYERAKALVDAMMRCNGIDVLCKTRRFPIPACRGMVARQLRKEGYKVVDVGNALHCHHSTVTHMQGYLDYALDHPRMYPGVKDLWENFQNAIQ